ncbi:MAG: glycosyltransferase family 4 protein [Chitinivibrionales bacterium]|nr:glycosyltransferase family 4 protein [Chitinivibrionales bacterium]
MKRTAFPRILFITRRYPPSIGGIQQHCYKLFTYLQKQCPVTLIALKKESKLHMVWFLPYALLVGMVSIFLKRFDVIYCGDGVVGFLAIFFRLFSKTRIVTTIYGLEMTLKNPVARRLMLAGIQAVDAVAVISESTRMITENLGVNRSKLTLIYVGVEPMTISDTERQEYRRKFESEHPIRFGQDRVLLNFGRLVPRKGVAAFLQKGFPLLSPDIKLVIGGDGPDFKRICQLRDELNAADRVIILKQPSDQLIAMLRSCADLFIFPNVPTPHNLEGFGMTQLESMYSGMPVVAFAVDALVESVREGGYLIEPNNYPAFIDAVHAYFALPEEQKKAKRSEAAAYVTREYSWEKTGRRYLDLFNGNGE